MIGALQLPEGWSASTGDASAISARKTPASRSRFFIVSLLIRWKPGHYTSERSRAQWSLGEAENRWFISASSLRRALGAGRKEQNRRRASPHSSVEEIHCRDWIPRDACRTANP